MPYCDEHDKTTLCRFGRNKGKPFGYAGFQTWVSKKQWDNLPGQIADAIRFLRRYREDLKRLRNEYKARVMTLDFPYYLRIGRNNIVVQCDTLPPTLSSLAGELGIGIEMSLYPGPKVSKGRKKRKVGAMAGLNSARKSVPA